MRDLAVRRGVNLDVRRAARSPGRARRSEIVQVHAEPRRQRAQVHAAGRAHRRQRAARPAARRWSPSRTRGPASATPTPARSFNRWHQTKTGRDRGGTGLGLAIARAIVEAHGGRIGAGHAHRRRARRALLVHVCRSPPPPPRSGDARRIRRLTYSGAHDPRRRPPRLPRCHGRRRPRAARAIGAALRLRRRAGRSPHPRSRHRRHRRRAAREPDRSSSSDGRIAAVGAKVAIAARRARHRSHRQDRDPRPRRHARAPLLAGPTVLGFVDARRELLRPAALQLPAALPGGRRHHHAHRRQHGAVHRSRGQAARSTPAAARSDASTSPAVPGGHRTSSAVRTRSTAAEDSARMVNYWADRGVTSFKAYTHVTARAARRRHRRARTAAA